jgi:hypothetical protein
MRGWTLSVLVVFASATGTSTVAADNSAQAERLFQDGKRLMDRGELAKACEAFAASQRLDPRLSTQMNLADCHEKRGKFATAWENFLDVARATRGDRAQDALHQSAERRARALERRLSYLTVRVRARTPGLTVQRNGAPLEAGALGRPLPVDGGEHVVVASAPGHERWTRRVTVAPANAREVVDVPRLALVDRSPRPPARLRIESTLYGGGGGFVTVGALGFEVGGSYGLSPRWDVHGAFLYGRAETVDGVDGVLPIALRVVRVRVTRHFPRDSRVQPFVGASALINYVTIEHSSAAMPGAAIEPGVIVALTPTLRLFVEVPIGLYSVTPIEWRTSDGGTRTERINGLFGGIGAGLQFGGHL